LLGVNGEADILIKIEPGDPKTHSENLIEENVARLKELFPSAVVEGKIDFDTLRQLLGGRVDDREEKFGLNWHGKRRVRQLALTPSSGTLRPRPEDSMDWETTQNLMIEGDNLEVLKLLQKSYAGKVKLIYIDPPYNTGKDFVFRDDFRDNIRNYLEVTGQVAGGRKITGATETGGRFHTDWLNMMYPRLMLARRLLRPDGALFISIDDSEAHHLRVVCDEVFGPENFICRFVWKSKSGGANDSRHVAVDHEYVLAYARDALLVKFNLDREAKVTTSYNLRDAKGEYALDRLDKQSLGYVESLDFPIEGPDGKTYRVEHKNPKQKVARWRWGKDTVAERYDELVFKDGYVYTKNYRKAGAMPRSLLVEERFGRTRTGKTELANLMGMQVFDNPKPTKLLRFLISVASEPDCIIMDFFAGSGTTGHAVMAQNVADGGKRRYILVQLPEPLDPSNKDQKAAADYCDTIGKPRNIAELTKERLRRAGAKIREEISREAAKDTKENQEELFAEAAAAGEPSRAVDLGFRVFKLDAGNIRAWSPDRGNLEEPLRMAGSDEDILYEWLLDLGMDLCAAVETKPIAGAEVRSVGGGALMACLSARIDREAVKPLARGIAAWREELAPAGDTTCVFREDAFADDAAKTSMTEILRRHGVKNARFLPGAAQRAKNQRGSHGGVITR
jgi:adenine-specific DNA-methyltransferase